MNVDYAEAFKLQLRADLKTAMPQRRAAETSAIRSLIAAVDNAQAVAVGDLHKTYVVREFGDRGSEVPRRVLSKDDVDALLAGEIADRRKAIEQYQAHEKNDAAIKLLNEIVVLERYLTR
jgi:uncharacterized protein YqeY